MIHTVQHFHLSIYGELIKLKNTLALLVAVGVPLFLALINFIIYYSDGNKLVAAGTNPWPGYIFQLDKFWAGLLMSLTIILGGALVNAIEHSNSTWKRVYTSPMSKGSVYFAKLAAFVLLNLLTAIILPVFIQLFGYLLIIAKPELGFQEYNSFFYESVASYARMMLAGSFIIAFQFLLTFHFHSFVLPMVIGFCITVGAGIASQWEHIDLIPYAYPSLSLRAERSAATLWDIYTLRAVILFGVTSIIGYWTSSRREIY